MNAIILSILWGVLMMLGGVFFKKRSTPRYVALVGIILMLLANGFEFFNGPVLRIELHGQLAFSNFGLLVNMVAILCTFLLFLLNGREFEKAGAHVSEYFSLIFFVLCGVAIATSYKSLLLLFLAVELMAVPLYVLVGITKSNLKGTEASLKYFLTGIFFTAIMVFGIALIYGGNSLGSFQIDFIDIGNGKVPKLIMTGAILLLPAMAYYVSAAPFHFWSPDVYDGAPTVVTSFMSTIVKTGAFVAFLRLFENSFIQIKDQWQLLLVIMIVASLVIGNLSAIFQRSVKRMLAYGAIGQVGFMLFSVFSLNDTGKEGLLLYCAAFSLAFIGVFAVIGRLSDYTIDGFNGLGKRQPIVALCTVILLLSLTGIPLTGGFTAKLWVLLAALKDGHYLWLVIFAALFIPVSAVYYFRVIQAIYFKEVDSEVNKDFAVSSAFRWVLICTTALIIVLGCVPNLLIDWMYY